MAVDRGRHRAGRLLTRFPLERLGLAAGLAALAPTALTAQPASARIAAQAIGLWTSLDPTATRRADRQLVVTQPILLAEGRLSGGWARITLDGEGITLADGELTPGGWGEGFVDRRHPHTFVHEAMVGWTARQWRAFAGKGFVPFGSADPMNRPLVAFPVNHHLAQILERAQVGAALTAGPVELVGALFNGDEPETPWQWPRLARFGDSWAIRLGVRPLAGLEVSVSRARVTSPESRLGGGPDQTKWHAAIAGAGRLGALDGEGLVEWARTDEAAGLFRYSSLLAEGALGRGRHRAAYRFERTDRPEEERLSAFRAVRPHADNSRLGVTRWTLHTAQYRYRTAAGRFAVEPFVEATVGRVRETAGGVFDVDLTYGRASLERLAIGLRVAIGPELHRIGHH